MGGQWHKAQKMFPEQPLALVDTAARENMPGGGKLQCAVFELGEFQNMQRFGDREQVGDIQ